MQKQLMHRQDSEDDDLEITRQRLSFMQTLHLILPLSMVPIKDIELDDQEDSYLVKQYNQPLSSQSASKSFIHSESHGEKKRLRGYETLQELRDKAAGYRQDYLNWRKFKPKGAKGETTDIFTGRKPSKISVETSFLKQQPPLTKDATSMEMTHDLLPETPTTALKYITNNEYVSPTVVTSLDTKELQKTADDEDAWLRFYYNPFTPAETRPVLKISTENLDLLAARGVIIPTYTRSVSEVTHWILHLGVGQFHRSHQLVFLDDLLSLQTKDETKKVVWAYCGVGLMPHDLKMANALRDQNHLYTVMTRTNTMCSVRVIGSMLDYIFAYDDPQRALEKLLSPNLHIVSLTITEKGYCQNVFGNLDFENIFIQSDLELFKKAKDKCVTDQSPQTAIGFLYWGLHERYRRGLAPFTVMSCDNLPENGHVAKLMLMAFASHLDRNFSEWIDQNIKFPCTMVDRITPATVLEHREILEKDYGLVDEWPVVTEEFMQWAIEDNFTLRPQWETVGALLVSDVRPLELMKLRLLNGGHCVIGYLSYLAGYQFVDDAVNDIKISSFLRAYMDEMTSTIRNVSIELERYKEKIVERFGNRMIKDRLLRLCEDGSTKIYNTMKDALTELISEQRHVHCTALGIAGFILFLTESSPEIILDAKKAELILLAKDAIKHLPKAEKVSIFLQNIFGTVIGENACFINHTALALYALRACSPQRVLFCGGSLEALFDSQLRSAELYNQFIEFFKIS